MFPVPPTVVRIFDKHLIGRFAGKWSDRMQQSQTNFPLLLPPSFFPPVRHWYHLCIGQLTGAISMWPRPFEPILK
jgi:hypothetical protein